MTDTQCCICRAECAVAAFPRTSDLPIMARDASGRAWCQTCAADGDRFAIGMGRDVVAYLSGDGHRVTTWAGETLARVTRASESRTGWHGSRITAWRARVAPGVTIYGRGGGRGMCTTAHRARVA